jgi:hypothetical protein
VETKPEGATPNINNTGLVTNMIVAGEYKFKLVVTGSNDVTKTEYVTVTVNADVRQPTASISVPGGNTITPPAYPNPASVTLNGGASTAPDGLSISSYTWTMKSTPDGVLGTPTPVGTGVEVTASNLKKAGNYVFVLTVKSSNNIEKSSEVTVTVKPWEVSKDVEVTFPAFVAGATLSFEPTYTPAIAGGGFADGDVVYIVTDDQGNTWDSTTGYDASVTLYTNPTTVIYTLTYKHKDGTVIDSQDFKASTSSIGGGRFSSIRDIETDTSMPAIPSMNLSLEKEVTELP